ncbi:MAG: hypothetical protein GY842_21590, partial [bacterium]|nr:hypothetical protein [bacterium]
ACPNNLQTPYDKGLANINLEGMPFKVSPGQFTNDGAGNSATGTDTISEDGRVYDITGGGCCGWRSTGTISDPFNNKGDFSLLLEYDNSP